MNPQDWIWLAAGEAVFLAAMALIVWLVRRDERRRAEERQIGRELQASAETVRSLRRFIVVRDVEPMDDARLCMALSQLTDTHPAWIALNQVLQEQLDNAISQVSSPQMATEPGAMAHTAGGIEWLRALQLALEEARNGRRVEGRAA